MSYVGKVTEWFIDITSYIYIYIYTVYIVQDNWTNKHTIYNIYSMYNIQCILFMKYSIINNYKWRW